jgi:hypothetical protein
VATGETQHGRSQRLRNRLVLCISWFKLAITGFDVAVATQIGYLKFPPFFCLKFNLILSVERQQGDGSFLISVLVHSFSEAASLHFEPNACGI